MNSGPLCCCCSTDELHTTPRQKSLHSYEKKNGYFYPSRHSDVFIKCVTALLTLKPEEKQLEWGHFGTLQVWLNGGTVLYLWALRGTNRVRLWQRLRSSIALMFWKETEFLSETTAKMFQRKLGFIWNKFSVCFWTGRVLDTADVT